jgi:hypothetical protein
MYIVLATSAVHLGFDHYVESNQRLLVYMYIASPLSTQYLGVRANAGELGIRIMCPSGLKCCFSELAL